MTVRGLYWLRIVTLTVVTVMLNLLGSTITEQLLITENTSATVMSVSENTRSTDYFYGLQKVTQKKM